jgi:hypothetical protein
MELGTYSMCSLCRAPSSRGGRPPIIRDYTSSILYSTCVVRHRRLRAAGVYGTTHENACVVPFCGIRAQSNLPENPWYRRPSLGGISWFPLDLAAVALKKVDGFLTLLIGEIVLPELCKETLGGLPGSIWPIPE